MPASLLEVAEELATDVAAKAAFAADPDGFLAERGLEDLGSDDLATALEHVADALPTATALDLPWPDPGADAASLLEGLAAVAPVEEDLDFGSGEAADLDPDDGPGTDDADEDLDGGLPGDVADQSLDQHDHLDDGGAWEAGATDDGFGDGDGDGDPTDTEPDDDPDLDPDLDADLGF